MTATLETTKLSYFPSLVFQFDVPDAETLNGDLMTLISTLRMADDEGIEKSNNRDLGGWHSRNVLHKLPNFRPFVDQVHSAGQRISEDLNYDEEQALRISTMWAIQNPPGAFNLSHVHPGCLWSGVYYVQAPEDSGKISFTDPRIANVMNKPRYSKAGKVPKKCRTKVSFTPRAGMMLIFPSWLYHAVEPNRATAIPGQEQDSDRVIISFNIVQQRKK